MTCPKVSICIPTYKQPDLLRKALASILKQDYTNYEVVITDDSPDTSVEEALHGFNNRGTIRYIRNTERKGAPENWNEAIKHANGEYIKILHHDDWFPERDSLAKFVKMLDGKPNANFAFSGSLNIDPEGKLKFIHTARARQIRKLKKDPKILFAGNFIGAPSATIFRKSLDIYFDPQFKWVVDLDFYIRVLERNSSFEYTQEPLVAIGIQSAERVTAGCLDKREIQIREYLNLYKKIATGSAMRSYQFGYIWHLFEQFKIKSHQDIRECGYDGAIPLELNVILQFQHNKILQLPLILWGKITGLVHFVLKAALVGCAFTIACINKWADKINNKFLSHEKK